MNQSQFEQIHQNTWEEFQSLLEALESRKADKEEKKLPFILVNLFKLTLIHDLLFLLKTSCHRQEFRSQAFRRYSGV